MECKRVHKSKKEEVNKKFKEIGVDIGIITEIKNKNINNRAHNVSVTGYNDITENLYNKEIGGQVELQNFTKKRLYFKRYN